VNSNLHIRCSAIIVRNSIITIVAIIIGVVSIVKVAMGIIIAVYWGSFKIDQNMEREGDYSKERVVY